jgi:hypothetical protein
MKQWFDGGDDQVPDAGQRLVITLFGVLNMDAVATIPGSVEVLIHVTGNITDQAGCVQQLVVCPPFGVGGR